MYAKTTKRIGFSPVRTINKQKIRPCNICGTIYRPHTAFDRYCSHCKQNEELLRFSDWLPEIDAALTARVSA